MAARMRGKQKPLAEKPREIDSGFGIWEWDPPPTKPIKPKKRDNLDTLFGYAQRGIAMSMLAHQLLLREFSRV